MLPIRLCMTIFQYHLIIQDISPSYKVLVGSIESFINHHTTITVILHTKLLRIVFLFLPKSAISKI
jgi:hypothetical protein